MVERKFTKEHEWVEKSDQIVIVGITEFAQDQLGDVVSIELPQVSSSFKQNDVMVIIDSVKASSDIYCPIDGEIIEINEKLSEQPELINQSPYEEGWIVKIKPSSPEQIDSLLSKEQYDELVGQSKE
ncbi:MAG TPA: glycine cleavage system protein GcvH [Nitrosopumilus sp.]|nr:glycine cleavage system protein GcvH [Thermoproteota archaeon]HJJ22423.1 glycine cleavage system protein GcvH [Nitrosopumilus sp.]